MPVVNIKVSHTILPVNSLIDMIKIGNKDVCGKFGSGPNCCTDEILNSYATLLSDDLKRRLDSELIHLSRIFAVAKQQTDGK